MAEATLGVQLGPDLGRWRRRGEAMSKLELVATALAEIDDAIGPAIVEPATSHAR